MFPARESWGGGLGFWRLQGPGGPRGDLGTGGKGHTPCVCVFRVTGQKCRAGEEPPPAPTPGPGSTPAGGFHAPKGSVTTPYPGEHCGKFCAWTSNQKGSLGQAAGSPLHPGKSGRRRGRSPTQLPSSPPSVPHAPSGSSPSSGSGRLDSEEPTRGRHPESLPSPLPSPQHLVPHRLGFRLKEASLHPTRCLQPRCAAGGRGGQVTPHVPQRPGGNLLCPLATGPQNRGGTFLEGGPGPGAPTNRPAAWGLFPLRGRPSAA